MRGVAIRFARTPQRNMASCRGQRSGYKRSVAERTLCSMHNLTRFFALSPDMLVVLNLRQGHALRVTPATSRLLGWNEEELLYQHIIGLENGRASRRESGCQSV